MILQFHFTDVVTQISEQKFQELLAAGYRNRLDIHEVGPYAALSTGYAWQDADLSLANREGCLYYEAPPSHSVPVSMVKPAHYGKLIQELCKFHLGASEREVNRSPESYEGLPFFDLVFFSFSIMGRAGAQRLYADFQHVASDGVEREFISVISGLEFGDDLVEIYEFLKEGFSDAFPRGGSFVITSK